MEVKLRGNGQVIKRKFIEGRDLAPTSDSREWIAAVLKQHWYLNDRQINDIFPGITPVNKRLLEHKFLILNERF